MITESCSSLGRRRQAAILPALLLANCCRASEHRCTMWPTLASRSTERTMISFVSLHLPAKWRKSANPVPQTLSTSRLYESAGVPEHQVNATSGGTSRRGLGRDVPTPTNAQLRKELLRQNLMALGMDANILEQAVQQSMENPIDGYDGRFGRSAIRTCRTFYYPKTLTALDDVQVKAAAARTARQVEFLWKRHRSHQTEWVRHHDRKIGCAPRGKQFPLILLLDNLRSADNVGSLFRTADAAGCSEVVTVGITPHPFGSGAEKVQKAALGAQLTVPTTHFATVTAALNYLQQEKGYQLVGVETTARSVLYTDYAFDATKGVVLILGNEVTGVDTAVMSQLDGIVEIPMFGTKNSLNVAACAPIVLYEIVRQWNSAPTTVST